MENPKPTQEILSEERDPITDECRESLLQYLRESSDSAIGEEVRLPTYEETELAEGLLSLGLPRSDASPNRNYTFADSNYNPDVALRDVVMKEYSLEDCQIRRHDIALTRGNSVLPVKIINLAEVKLDENRSNVYTNIKNGILFVGKIKFEGNDTKYIELTPEELDYIKSFIEKNKTKE